MQVDPLSLLTDEQKDLVAKLSSEQAEGGCIMGCIIRCGGKHLLPEVWRQAAQRTCYEQEELDDEAAVLHEARGV